MIQIQNVGPAIVTLFVQCENGIASERRFDKGLTISQLRTKLEPLTGILPCNQKLQLWQGKTLVGGIEGDDSVMLGAFPVESFMTLKIIDLNPSANLAAAFNDLSQADKYEMADDKYNQLKDTVRDFKRRNKIGRFEDSVSAASSNSAIDQDAYASEAQSIEHGARCEVDLEDQGQGRKRGTVRFVGMTDFKPGYWVGVEYDEPVGKHNGTVGGKVYFQARTNHGAFVRPNRVTTGHFPELDIFEEV